jgi:hypothetical protein
LDAAELADLAWLFPDRFSVGVCVVLGVLGG